MQLLNFHFIHACTFVSNAGLTAVVCVKVPEPEFEGQTKTRLGNPEVSTSITVTVNTATLPFCSNPVLFNYVQACKATNLVVIPDFFTCHLLCSHSSSVIISYIRSVRSWTASFRTPSSLYSNGTHRYSRYSGEELLKNCRIPGKEEK